MIPETSAESIKLKGSTNFENALTSAALQLFVTIPPRSQYSTSNPVLLDLATLFPVYESVLIHL